MHRAFASSLLRDLWRLLRSWWRTDRIRISPREGELMRLEAGDIVVIQRCVAQVTGRRVVEISGGTAIVYDLTTETGKSCLEVPIVNGWSWRIAVCRENGVTDVVFAEEIAVFGR